MQMLSLGNAEEIIVAIEHRAVDGDGGPSLHLLVRTLPRPPQQETRRYVQVWRADCFKKDPHEHLFGPTDERIRDFPPGDVAYSVSWCLQKLAEDNGRHIVREAGYPETAEKLPQDLITPEVLAHIRMLMFRQPVF